MIDGTSPQTHPPGPRILHVMELDPTKRFSSRVDNYVRYRPGYPDEVLDLLAQECGLGPGSSVADVGSGTGISTRLLLKSGAFVYGVEPNHAMRAAAESEFAGNPRFKSVDAAAEATTLPAQSIDLILAGQAFHWFDQPLARAEFERILVPGGWVVLMWNKREDGGSEFLDGFEKVLQTYAEEYPAVRHRNIAADEMRGFLGDGMQTAAFANRQSFDFEGLKGRLLSSSYAPEPDHANYEPMIEALTSLFENTNVGGKVEFLYRTELYYSQFG